MTEMEELVRRLQSSTPRTVDERELQSWRSDCAALIQDLRSWLGPGVEAGVFFLTDLEVDLDEEDFGPYTLPGLQVQILSPTARSVKVLPRGGRIMGLVNHEKGNARGRVDLVSGPSRAVLLRFLNGSTRWMILDRSGHASHLDADTFARVLGDLVA